MDENTAELLGRTLADAKKMLGSKFMSYQIRGQDVLVWEVEGQSPVSCVMDNDVIISVNQREEKREFPRIVPGPRTNAFIRYGDRRVQGEVIDISSKSVALAVPPNLEIDPGQFVSLCTSLLTRATTKIFITLAGCVYRYDKEKNRLVIIFDIPFQTQSSRTLNECINTFLALRHVGCTSPEILGDDAGVNVSIVKSDVCVYCKEGVCGLAHDAYRGKPAPLHAGIMGMIL